jgi:oligopeptide/dipeptide ABC transporter ATP-binding protein
MHGGRSVDQAGAKQGWPAGRGWGTEQQAAPLVEAMNLRKHFPVGTDVLARRHAVVRAVDGVTLAIGRGETLGLVGYSGCGKSTFGRCLLRLIEPTGGTVRFDGADLAVLSPAELRRMRRYMQIVFQDPYGSLNPRLRVGAIVAEGLEIHRLARGAEKRDRVIEMLRLVGLREDAYDRYPHEFSGGQRQRIGIARALAVGPRFLVADEPVSALDVSVQAQVINLLQDLQERFALTYLFVAHDLRVVEHVSHRVAIMYLGKIVEVAPRDALFGRPCHPYTRALLSAIPSPTVERRGRREVLPGDVPSAINPPPGCTFHPRCSYAEERCLIEKPALRFGGTGHGVACHVFAAPGTDDTLGDTGSGSTTRGNAGSGGVAREGRT